MSACISTIFCALLSRASVIKIRNGTVSLQMCSNQTDHSDCNSGQECLEACCIAVATTEEDNFGLEGPISLTRTEEAFSEAFPGQNPQVRIAASHV